MLAARARFFLRSLASGPGQTSQGASQMPETASDRVEPFISRWQSSGGAERANAQLFLSELCDLLELLHPEPAGRENGANHYTVERAVTRLHPDGSSSSAFIDLYRAECFVLESKQGVPDGEVSEDRPASPRKTGHGKRGTPAWDTALERAYNQARRYIRDLPAAEGRPPFLIVCDVGHLFELYSEFTCTGGVYVRFRDPQSHRIYLEDLRRPEIRQRLRAVWLDPLSLDPARHAAAVTRDIATTKRKAEISAILETLRLLGQI